jgi:hypothetical protein
MDRLLSLSTEILEFGIKFEDGNNRYPIIPDWLSDKQKFTIATFRNNLEKESKCDLYNFVREFGASTFGKYGDGFNSIQENEWFIVLCVIEALETIHKLRLSTIASSFSSRCNLPNLEIILQ